MQHECNCACSVWTKYNCFLNKSSCLNRFRRLPFPDFVFFFLNHDTVRLWQLQLEIRLEYIGYYQVNQDVCLFTRQQTSWSWTGWVLPYLTKICTWHLEWCWKLPSGRPLWRSCTKKESWSSAQSSTLSSRSYCQTSTHGDRRGRILLSSSRWTTNNKR